jgi:hypothetical protein
MQLRARAADSPEVVRPAAQGGGGVVVWTWLAAARLGPAALQLWAR